MRRTGVLTVAALATLPAAAHSAETITYTYDAKWRLVKDVHTGTYGECQRDGRVYPRQGRQSHAGVDHRFVMKEERFNPGSASS